MNTASILRRESNSLKYKNYKEANNLSLCKELNYRNREFRNYLTQPFNEDMILDLSDYNLMGIIECYINYKSRINPKTSKLYSCLIHNLYLVQNQFNCELMPWQITDIFWSNFVPFLIKRGLALSTIKTVTHQLRSVLSWSSKHRAIISDSYNVISIPNYHNEQISLSPDEVSRIYHFDIYRLINRRYQYLKHLEKVRDMFVLSCNLGQRFSDMVRIDKDCFDRNKFSIVQLKTGNKAYLDIDRLSIDRKTTYIILEKYNYTCPISSNDISNYNHYLKELLQYIGLDDEIKRETKINSIIQTEYIPKFKLISSHTSRRTFVTYNILRGNNIIEIRRATGHKSQTAFERYLCFND